MMPDPSATTPAPATPVDATGPAPGPVAAGSPSPTPAAPSSPAPAATPSTPTPVAAAPTTAAEAPTASAPKPGDAAAEPPATAPKLGTRIQVLWRLTFDEKDPSTSSTAADDTVAAAPSGDGAAQPPLDQWWGAVVQDCTAARVGAGASAAHAERRVHVLLYDALHGFAPETSRVAFLPGRQLLDLAQLDGPQAGVLDWRVDGETDDDDDMEDAPGSDVHSMRALADEVDSVVREAGIEADADLRALATMPHAKQMRLATGFRSFADALKARLAALVATKPDGYIVTKDDINTIMAELRHSDAIAHRPGSLPGPVQ